MGLAAAGDWRRAFVALPPAATLVAGAVLWAYVRQGGATAGTCEPPGLWRRGGAAGWVVGEVAVFGAVRPTAAVSWVALAGLCFLAGARTIAGAAVGLQLADGRRLAAMSARTAALQLGYLIGSAVGGVALASGGYPTVGAVFAVLFVLAGLPHPPAVRARGLPLRRPSRSPAAP